ncbi:MAG: DUF5680 domain-containing protein [Candidatus Pacearchaeota archaeon]|jgi:hypothetical protein
MKLSEFLVKAKIATYASESGANEKILEDGAKELTSEKGEFKYRDRYYGFNPFSGEEIVWKKDKIIWGMNYFGKISSDIVSGKEVYNFLKKAMRQVKQDRPFRGPNKFNLGNFRYVDESTGDVNRFRGIEKIFFNNHEIYCLDYHGGIM